MDINQNFILKKFFPVVNKRVAPWDCGYKYITSRMEDTGAGFSQPFKQIFSHFITIKLTLPTSENLLYYRARITEKIWHGFYFPLAAWVIKIASYTKITQQGKISVYLLYMGLTLIILLSLVVWL